MKKLFLAALTLSLCSPLPARAETMLGEPGRLTILQSLSVGTCLRALDGYQDSVKVGGADQIIVRAYEFKSGTLRWAIARNISITTEIENATQVSRNQIIKELTAGQEQIKPNTPENAEFTRQWEALLKTPTALSDKFIKIKLADLKLDKNEIPSGSLSGCTPIIEP